MDIAWGVIEVLKWITIILACITTPFMLWVFIVSLFGLKKPKPFKKLEDKQYNFAVIICARNEEPIIRHLIESLEKQVYKQFKCFVIADNCTDETARVAKEAGATVYERFSDTQKGKGYALKYGLEKIKSNFPSAFDAVCVFDADNLVDENFLGEMNTALCSGGDICTGYRDTKNINDNWLSECYSIYWLMFFRFYHTSRYNIKLQSFVGGTGFVFKMNLIEKEGWNTTSLTEDIEFSIQSILKRKRVIPVRAAVFFDEQPTTSSVANKQRLRWLCGHIQCLQKYALPLLKSFFSGNYGALDALAVLLSVVSTGFTVFISVTSIISMPYALGTPSIMPLFAIGVVAFNLLFWLFVSIFVLLIEKKSIKGRIRGVFTYPIFMITMMFIALRAIINPNTEWVPITHISKKTIDDMKA